MKTLLCLIATLALLTLPVTAENPNLPDKVRYQTVKVDADGSHVVGMVVDKDQGIVLTCFHGKKGKPDLFINGKLCEILGADPSNDLMLLKVPIKFTSEVKFTERPYYVLDEVIVYGMPVIKKFIPTKMNIAFIEKGTYFVLDEAICHGNSGSPVYNKKWEVIGMAIAMIADTCDTVIGDINIRVYIPVLSLVIDKAILQLFIKKHSPTNE